MTPLPEETSAAERIADVLWPDGRDAWWRASFEAALTAFMEARERAAELAYRACAETRHVSLGDKVAEAIRNGGHLR